MDTELLELSRDLDIWVTEKIRFVDELFEKNEISESGRKKLQSELNNFFFRVKALKEIAESPLRGVSRLRRLRTKRGLTQEEVAAQVGISRYWYQLLETGADRNISREIKERVCEALKVSYEEIFVTTWWGKKTPEQIKKMLGA